MDIIYLTPANIQTITELPHVQYCGRYAGNWGLGNPWEWKASAPWAAYRCPTKEVAINQYRDWINGMINSYFLKETFPYGMDGAYLHRVITLSRNISAEKITALTSFEFYCMNYTPVPEGQEQCHTELLYKACLRLIKHEQRKSQKAN